MGRASDIRVVQSSASVETLAYRTPIKFGGRVVISATVLNVQVEVETRNGHRSSGNGSMPLGNAWAWPSKLLTGEQTLVAMQTLGEQLARDVCHREAGHPIEIMHDFQHEYAATALAVQAQLKLAEPFSALAILVAASPVDAAVHDAYGKVLGENSYNVLDAHHMNRDLGSYLGDQFAGEYLDRYTTRTPKPTMPLYHLVGALDPLDAAELSKPVGDGLPETLGDWIARDELTHLKIKLAGDDLLWDVARVLGLERVAMQAQLQRNVVAWNYSCDFNEKCADVEYVLDFLAKVREQSPAAYERIQYIEQPTSRDLKSKPENRMHRAARLKPVVIDEALVDYESLLLAREQGYSGVALKACKGQTESLLMGAAAQKFGMFLCVQDLTCPGASFLHSASLAARLPTVAAIEGNGRQYCPAGNRGWSERYPDMFHIKNGTVQTSELTQVGLGF